MSLDSRIEDTDEISQNKKTKYGKNPIVYQTSNGFSYGIDSYSRLVTQDHRFCGSKVKFVARINPNDYIPGVELDKSSYKKLEISGTSQIPQVGDGIVFILEGEGNVQGFYAGKVNGIIKY